MTKEEMIKECLDRTELGGWFKEMNIKKDGKEIRRGLYIFSEASNILMKNIYGYLIDKPSKEILESDLIDKLTKIVELTDKSRLLGFINEEEELAREILKEVKETNFKIAFFYGGKNEKVFIPFFVKDRDYLYVTSDEEVLSQFLPVFNEWTDREEGYTVGHDMTRYVLVDGVLEIVILRSDEDFDRLLREKIEKYNELKAKYPKEAEFIEKIYPSRAVK